MWDLCWGFKHDLLLFVIFARILGLNLYDRMLLDRSTIILCFAGAIWLLHNLLWSKSTQWFGSAMSRDMSLLLPARVQLCYINNWCARYKLFSLLDCHIVTFFFFFFGGGGLDWNTRAVWLIKWVTIFLSLPACEEENVC